VRIAAPDIDRVSAERDYMRLHVARRSWLIHHSMAALEEGLDPELFVRLSIARRSVRKVFHHRLHPQSSGRWIARLADASEQPVGRLYFDGSGASPDADQPAVRRGDDRRGPVPHVAAQ